MKLLFLALLGVVATAVDDICSSADTGLVDPQQLAIACEQTPNAAMQNKMGIEVSVHRKSDASDVRNK